MRFFLKVLLYIYIQVKCQKKIGETGHITFYLIQINLYKISSSFYTFFVKLNLFFKEWDVLLEITEESNAKGGVRVWSICCVTQAFVCCCTVISCGVSAALCIVYNILFKYIHQEPPEKLAKTANPPMLNFANKQCNTRLDLQILLV